MVRQLRVPPPVTTLKLTWRVTRAQRQEQRWASNSQRPPQVRALNSKHCVWGHPLHAILCLKSLTIGITEAICNVCEKALVFQATFLGAKGGLKYIAFLHCFSGGAS